MSSVRERIRAGVRAVCLLWGCAALAALAVPPAAAKDEARPTAEEGVAAIVAAARAADAEALARALPDSVVRRVFRTAEALASWRAGMTEAFTAATVEDVRESGDDAVVRMAADGRTFELPLRFAGGHWHVASPWAYDVAGARLAEARGPRPATVALAVRNEDRQWRGTAYSFAYATDDPEHCKNRMNVWLCHCGALHANSGDSRIADIGRSRALDTKGGIPLGATWAGKATAAAGHSYVVHCVRDDTFDFYAILRVEKLTDAGAEIRWTLLTGGRGAPRSIHSPQRDESNDGGDGAPGICGESAR